jgi:hypothetical protein
MTREEAIEVLENGGWWDLLIPITTIEGRIEEDKLHEALDLALTALRPVSREQVEKVQGEWIPVCDTVQDVLREFPQYEMLRGYKCSLCGRFEEKEQPFCNCGAPMTDEAVQMVMERLEELNNA